jgi:GNAT superfamily N-acetyltransferase
MQIEKKVVKEAFAIKFIAKKDGTPIGRAFLYLLYNDLHKEPFGFLEDIFVDAEHRGKGVGRALVEAAVEEAKKEKCYKLICTSRHARKELHDWYKKLGFADHGLEFRIDF